MKRSLGSVHVLGLPLSLALGAAALGTGCAGGPDASTSSVDGPSADAGTTPTTAPEGPTERAADAGLSEPRSACETYLSCLLAVTPTAYGAAVQLYGEAAACWATPAQSEGCGKACDAAFEQIGKQCRCAGTVCTKCEFPYGSYTQVTADTSGCTQAPWSLDVSNGSEGPALRVRVDSYESFELPLVCTSPASFAQTIDRGCQVDWTGSVASSGSGIVVTGSKKTTCPGEPAPHTCTFKWSASKVR